MLTRTLGEHPSRHRLDQAIICCSRGGDLGPCWWGPSRVAKTLRQPRSRSWSPDERNFSITKLVASRGAPVREHLREHRAGTQSGGVGRNRFCKRCAAPVNVRPGGIAASDARPARGSVGRSCGRRSPPRHCGKLRRTRHTRADVAAGGPGPQPSFGSLTRRTARARCRGRPPRRRR